MPMRTKEEIEARIEAVQNRINDYSFDYIHVRLGIKEKETLEWVLGKEED